MGHSIFFLMLLFSLVSPFQLTHLFSSMQPLCHREESSALLQFKESFVINKLASADPSAYPKVASWKPEAEGGNCCLWDGIECDEDTGHVIGLDLSSSCLYGSINSSSSLFSLVYLQKINLAFNDFNYSHIPSRLGNLSRLTYLNLSYSLFSGQVPYEISTLSKLSSLDLSYNYDFYYEGLLELKSPDLTILVQNLTSLEHLHLSWVDISSPVPHILANFSSLTSLVLQTCKLLGEFPTAIFQLPNLQFLHVPNNPDLTGHLPEFHSTSHLKSLWLQYTDFSGEIPASIGNLHSLEILSVGLCKFSGLIPSSLSNLTQLHYVSLYRNNFSSVTLSWLGKQTRITHLCLENMNLHGEIPSSFANLTQLQFLDLSYNQFSGKFPSSSANLTQLQYLDLSYNQFSGKFPSSLANFTKLVYLELSANQFTGRIPSGLMNLTQLIYLSLACNQLQGPIPSSISELKNLQFLNLGSNNLQGSLPIPPFSTTAFLVYNNSLTGEISPLICNMSLIQCLDLSNNYLSGMIPQCLVNFSKDLTVLNLQSNNISGTIPQTWTNGCKLKMINFGQNKLQGQIPRSMAKCAMLETLDLGNNQINDTFPFWLGTLSELKVLILRFNGLHGAVWCPQFNSTFPKLRVIDLSSNNFIGQLPLEYFRSSKAMKIVDINQSSYMQANSTLYLFGYEYHDPYYYSMSMTNKGIFTSYQRIIETLTAIDLSCNRFEGEIPEFIGNLKGLHLLNLSNNILTGHIPLAIQNLTNLESLDLSQNKLSGEIPRQLVQLTFLEFFNVSHNHLTGQIPRGNQFDTFPKNSYDGNPGLCGDPLTIQRGNGEAVPESTLAIKEDQDTGFLIEFDWKIVLMGYGCGLLIGLLVGHIVTTRKHDWFMKTFGRRQQKRQRERRRGTRN